MKLLVSNLPTSITENGLYVLFQEFGNIRSCELCYNEFREPLGQAYVDFFNKDDALNAIETLNASIFEGKKIWVQEKKDDYSNRRKDPNYGDYDKDFDSLMVYDKKGAGKMRNSKKSKYDTSY